MSDGRARVRLFAQVGDSVLLYSLADVEVTSYVELAEVVHQVADEVQNMRGDLPGLERS